jgi:hypothetical protein
MKKTWATIVLAALLATLLGGCVTTGSQDSSGSARQDSPFPK